MNQQRIITRIAIACFLLTLFIYRILLQPVISLLDPSYTTYIIVVIVLTASFASIFDFTFYIYDRFLFKYFFERYDLGGTWYHITYIEHPEEKKSLRSGTFDIDRNLINFEINGRNYYQGRHLKSFFHSKMVAFSGRLIYIQYESRGGEERNDPIRNGVMWLTIEDGHLTGFWSDVKPSTYNGSITFFRNEKDFEEELQEASEIYNQQTVE